LGSNQKNLNGYSTATTGSKTQLLHRCPFPFFPPAVISGGGFDIAMTRKLLHRGDIHSFIQQVRDKRAPEIMGGKGFQPSNFPPFLQP
jgi:hypothetical protein